MKLKIILFAIALLYYLSVIKCYKIYQDCNKYRCAIFQLDAYVDLGGLKADAGQRGRLKQSEEIIRGAADGIPDRSSTGGISLWLVASLPLLFFYLVISLNDKTKKGFCPQDQ